MMQETRDADRELFLADILARAGRLRIIRADLNNDVLALNPVIE